MEKNHAAGFHEAWERELHKALSLAKEQAKEVTLDDRKKIVDNAVRRLGPQASNIVCCEFCQEEISTALLEGKNIFDEGLGVREMLESYGIKTPSFKKRYS